jgi:hypothetical protein
VDNEAFRRHRSSDHQLRSGQNVNYSKTSLSSTYPRLQGASDGFRRLQSGFKDNSATKDNFVFLMRNCRDFEF